MAAPADLPIAFRELFQLTSLGIKAESVSFNTVTMESDKFICVRETVGEKAQVVIIETANPKANTRINMLATAVIMNPEAKVLALRGPGAGSGEQLQIFNLELKSMLKEYAIPEEVHFWKWIDVKTIALVTGTAVYHWSMEGGEMPVKVFDRLPELANTQIINYKTNADKKWVVLIGIQALDARVVGSMQLFSIDRNQSQFIEGHAAAFHDFRQEAGVPANNIFCFAVRTAAAATLHIIEVGRQEGAAAYSKKQVNIFFPPEANTDFPVAMQISEKYNIAFMVTKFGYIHLYDLDTGTCLYMNRISGDTIFVTQNHTASSGIIGINRKGQVLTVAVNEATFVPYIISSLNNVGLAVKFASRYNLPGADQLFKAQFERLFQSGDFAGAAKIAAQSPAGSLRTPQTIQLFKTLPVQPGAAPPILQYFSILLEQGKLNSYETMELARPVLAQGKVDLLKKWLEEDKLECSEELGDVLKQVNPTLALSVYLRANVAQKVIFCFAEAGEFDKILIYANRVGFEPDWLSIIANLCRVNPDGAKDLAVRLVQSEGGPKVDPGHVTDIFARCGLVQQATGFLLEYLKPDREEDGMLQTRLLEMNLVAAPQVADAILGNDMVTHYDKQRVAELCEKAGLFQRALDNYRELKDVIRILTSINPAALVPAPDFIVNYFNRFDKDSALRILDAMLAHNLRQNLQAVIAVATKYSDLYTPQALIALFEKFNSTEGLFFYLGSVVNYSQDPDVHYKYIEAAAKANMFKEVERICRDSSCYDPERVKNFLKEQRLQDQLPLIIVCDRFDFVDELTRYLYSNNMMKYIEIYVRQVNPMRAPIVIGTLLDLDCNEDLVKELITSVRNMCPPEELIAEVEKRSRLKLLLPWLEQRVREGNQDVATFNAIAKIYIDTNNNAEQFLRQNDLYDPRVVGKYCEKRNPHLSIIAYTKGVCDEELIAVTNANQLFKDQARYLVKRRSPELWEKVLTTENKFRRQVIDQVVSTALTETDDPEDVSATVKAFMTANLPNELIELLEKIVLDSGRFSDNRNLQNLLILTAVKADQTKVKEYITKLNNYEALDIANICVGAELYEEAFIIFSKFNMHVQAVGVLAEYIRDLQRGKDYAKKVDQPDVWSKLGKAQLGQAQGTPELVKDAVDSYIRADDANNYMEVISVAQREDAFEELVRYLTMARKKLRETAIDTELVYAYAKTNRLSELEEFINGPNMASIQVVGERCFQQANYQAAKILFSNISNYARLATTLVRLGEFQPAVDAAKKANNITTWKEVNAACVVAEKYKLARICGLYIIINAEELEGIIRFYEQRGLFDELIALIDGGLGDERAHTGMFTELAVLYSKYQPSKLMDHLKMFRQKISTPKVLRACEDAHLWNELVFLYVHYDEFDNAVMTMIEHSGEAWDHVTFKDVVVQVANVNIAYKAVRFYVDEQPTLLVDLLTALTSKVEAARVVLLMRELGHLPLVKQWLQSVQSINSQHVNEALNELYIQEEDYNMLRESIEAHNNFDNMELAVTCERHQLLEFRRVAAHLYKKNERFKQSIDLSIKDKLWRDAMITAASSKQHDLANELLRFFVDQGNHECFAASLFTCYDLVRPDTALELAWRARIMDFVMPYLVQVVKDYTERVDVVFAANKAREESEAASRASQPEINVQMMMAEQQNQNLMLTYPGMGGPMGGPMGGAMGMNMSGGMSGGGNYYIST